MSRAASAILLAGVCACATPPSYRMNVGPHPGVAPLVLAAVEEVERDAPRADADAAVRERFAAYRQGSLLRGASASSGDIVSAAFDSRIAGQEAVHQLTAGLLDMPFGEWLHAFDPAHDWGRLLHGWRGGEVAVDQRDGSGRVLVQRERMVLGTPWYALGAPDQDVTKIEVVQRSADEVRVNWQVVHSANGSVTLDTGYVLFRAVEGGRTLVAFESAHAFDGGWLARLLPRRAERASLRDAVLGAFRAHVERYRVVVTRRRTRGSSAP